MTDEKEKKKSAMGTSSKNCEGSSLAFWLVVIMLGVLFLLVLSLLVLPLIIKDFNKDFMDYCKWALSVLLGAFGAWIGAGAAYFFGKENLKESSRSTESAMRIQQESFQRTSLIKQIKDMTLIAMNSEFFFDFEDTKEAVRKKLVNFFKGYWFVPVVEKDTGILQDIIHAQVFGTPASRTN